MSKANADDMLITQAGLWIASTNRWGSDSCGADAGHSGICLLPGQVDRRPFIRVHRNRL
jgi:hypothetical protein